ncbi:MFS transporter [Symbioplanes lichenis]|uniref:MFS transporter n=1 Tax=Symbioplanes lichenis TaxID=1629072 RepID=UPI0027383FDD|nr:MFS transporter [Actinoplanes lichenis]
MSSAAPPRARYSDVFAVPAFRVVLGGFSLMLISDTVKMLALSVLVYASTGSPLLAAVAYVSGFLPQVLGGTFFLALADRWRPRRLMAGYDLVRAAVVIVLALGVLPPATAMLLVFAASTFAPVAQAARAALTADLLTGDAYVLGRSLFSVVSGAMQVLGAAVGGLLITATGPYGALWVAAAACVASAVLSRWGLPDFAPRTVPAHGTIKATWQVNASLLRTPAIRRLLLAQWLPSSLAVGAEGVVVPYTASLGRESAAGLLLAAAAAGMLLGDLVIARFVAPAGRERLTPWLAVLLGAPLIAYIGNPGLIVAAALLTVATFGSAYQLGLARRFLEAVPSDRLGQAFGLANTGIMVAQGLAVAGAGALAEVVPPGVAIAVAGACSAVAALALHRTLRPQSVEGLTADRQVGPMAG